MGLEVKSSRLKPLLRTSLSRRTGFSREGVNRVTMYDQNNAYVTDAAWTIS